jgi:hypothetical protein
MNNSAAFRGNSFEVEILKMLKEDIDIDFHRRK